ncbi:MAG: hypothetical protein H6567_12220 [Lewinellaceae bacterium]|nr:hypothetical protein [Lewinellaceae bacterium]
MKSHLIDIVRNLAYEGKDFETIESEIEKLSDNYDSESINYAKLHIDEYIIQYQNAMIIKGQAKLQMAIGIILFIFGFGLTVSTIWEGSGFIYYGMMGFGIIVFIDGLNTYNAPIPSLASRRKIMIRRK